MLLFSSLLVLTVVPYSSLCKRGVVSCLKPAGTEIKLLDEVHRKPEQSLCL